LVSTMGMGKERTKRWGGVNRNRKKRTKVLRNHQAKTTPSLEAIGEKGESLRGKGKNHNENPRPWKFRLSSNIEQQEQKTRRDSRTG